MTMVLNYSLGCGLVAYLVVWELTNKCGRCSHSCSLVAFLALGN